MADQEDSRTKERLAPVEEKAAKEHSFLIGLRGQTLSDDERTAAQLAGRAIAYVPEFQDETPQFDLDENGTIETKHVDMVSAHLAEGGRVPIFVPLKETSDKFTSGMVEGFHKLAQEIEEGKLPAAPINLAVGRDFDIGSFGSALKIKLNAGNLAQNREKIVEKLQVLERAGDKELTIQCGACLENQIAKVKPSELRQELAAAERLTSLGCRIYLAAGNSGARAFDPMSLAKGVISVGSSLPDGTPDPISARHSLVTVWDSSPNNIQAMANGEYDVTNDGIADIKVVPAKDELVVSPSIPADLRNVLASSTFQNSSEISSAVMDMAAFRTLPDGRYSLGKLLEHCGASESAIEKFGNNVIFVKGLGEENGVRTVKIPTGLYEGTSFSVTRALIKVRLTGSRDDVLRQFRKIFVSF